MPFSFPASPAVGATSTQNGRQYKYVGSNVWELVAASGSGEDALLRSIFVPPAPTGLTATPGNAQVSLSWTAPTGVIAQAPLTDYSVQFKTSAASTWETFSRTASTTATQVVTGLVNGTAYVFRVAAVNAVGTGTPTAATSSVTPVAVTPDPEFSNVSLLLHMDSDFSDTSTASNTHTGVTAADISTSVKKFGGGSFALTSNAYKLDNPAAMQFGSVGTFTVECWVYRATTTMTLWQTFTNTGGAGGHIVASDANGQLLVYERERYVISASSSTQMPANAWTHVAMSVNADAVSLYIDGTRVGTGNFTAGAGSSGSNKCWIGGDIYGGAGGGFMDEFRVTKNIARYDGLTLTKPVAAFPDVGPPASPTSLTATAGNAQIALAWTAPSSNGGSAITGYTVEYTPSGGSAQTVSTGGTGTSYTLTGLTNGTTYAVRVAAVNAAGTSYSSSVNSTPNAMSAPTAVQNLVAVEQAWGNNASWLAPASDGGSAITSYRVVIAGNVDNAGTTTQSASQRTKFIQANSRESFSITIYAVNAIGESPGVTVSGQTGDNS
jgi:hypothetical protein